MSQAETTTEHAATRWLVTGVSSGLGRALAEHLLARGDTVIGVLRRDDQLAGFAALAPGRARPLKLDVAVDEAAGPVQQAIGEVGGLDVLVNNAGYALMGAIEAVSLEEARRQLDTNVLGALKMMQAVLPTFRQHGAGRVINIASVAGATGFPFNGLYAASKFALVGLTESLAKEMAPFGVKATVVEPGGFRTNFAGGSLALAGRDLPAYAAAMTSLRTRMEAFRHAAANDPAKAAGVIAHIAELDQPPLHVALGADGYRMVTEALKSRLADYEVLRELASDTAF